MKKKITIVVALIALAIATLGASQSMADDKPAWTEGTCVVTSTFWTWDTPDGGLDLPRAVFHASMQGDPNLQGCLNGISIQVQSQMLMYTPLLIKVHGNSAENPFVIDGGGSTGGQAVIDATNLAIPADSDIKCAIQIEGQYIRLANLRINNIANGYNGVCINAPNVILQNVDIGGGAMGGNNGIVFMGEGSFYNNAVMADSSVEGMNKGYAIDFGDISTSAFSTNHVYPIFPGDAIDDTDIFGISYVKSTAQKLQIKADVDKMFKNNSDERICVQRKMAYVYTDPSTKVKTDMVEFKGSIKVSSSDAAADLIKSGVAVDVKRLQIWGPDGLLGYVGAWRNDKQVGVASPTSSGSGSYTGLTGQFTFRLDRSKLGNNTRIILIPDMGDGRIGKVSSIFDVAAGCGSSGEQCPCSTVTDQQCILHPELPQCTGGSTGGSTGGWGTDHKGFKSMADCRNQRGITTPGAPGSSMSDPTWDTDGDGIPDDQEDVNLNCECDTMETCWKEADTDGDGIPDGVEKRPLIGTDVNDSNFKADNKCGTTGYVPQTGPNGSIDPDCDGLYNAIDKDSENDGKTDGQEDRNQYVFTVSQSGTNVTQGLLYPFGGSIFSAYPLQKKDGTGPITCDLGTASNIGVRYDWYQVFTDKDPARFNGFPSSADTNFSIQVFACRNQSLNSPKNFNGVYDQDNNEMNFEKPDTDSDGWCDGDGVACTGDAASHGKNDACPLITNEPADQNTCKDDKTCFEKMMFYTVDARYVIWDSEGNPVRLRDSGPQKDSSGQVIDDGSIANDHIPDVFQVKGGYKETALLCADTDQDGIPDCVENPSGKCGDGKCGTPMGSTDNPSGLKHYCADTDGDSFIDGYKGGALADVCPATKGSTDSFDKNRTSYSCDPTKVYTVNEATKYIAYYLDRDNDQLRDGEEDRSLNGLYDNIAKGKNGIGKTESNPLSLDSDNDTVPDILEFRGWPMATNPSDDDTDGDSFKDGDEDRDFDKLNQTPDQHLITVATKAKGMELCPNAMENDTDPTKDDTDGDGLSDSQEISGGALVVGNDFIKLLDDPAQFTAGIASVSDPTIADSDGDGLTDSQEYSGGVIKIYDTNPCMKDSDGDNINDPDEWTGCALKGDTHCKGSKKVSEATGDKKDTSGGLDSDSDGLPDNCELQLGTNPLPPNGWDTDADKISDADEIGYSVTQECMYDPTKGETDPNKADTDGDGLTDGYELKYGTDGTNIDSDADCIPDGPMWVTNRSTGQKVFSYGEDENQNGEYDEGSETDANTNDTDGDGLPDGSVGGMGEDLNCNGVRDQDSGGGWTETDPRLFDTDFDGNSDFEEMTQGGSFNIENIGRASTGRGSCSLVAAAEADVGGMLATGVIPLMGAMMLAYARAIARRIKRKSPA